MESLRFRGDKQFAVEEVTGGHKEKGDIQAGLPLKVAGGGNSRRGARGTSCVSPQTIEMAQGPWT